MLPSKPKHLSINCDQTKLCVIVEKDSCAVALIYEVASFYKAVINCFLLLIIYILLIIIF